MRSPIEQPEATGSAAGEPQLVIGGLWGTVAVPAGQPWVEWSADRDERDDAPAAVLGLD